MSVSAIIAAYNAEATIERAIRSVLAQTVPAHQVVVVNDVSTDGTRSLVEAMAAADPRIVLIDNPANRGPSGSRNAGIQAATGDWVAVLDADDAWAPGRLEVMMCAAARYGADVVTDNQQLYDAHFDEVTRVGFPVERGTRRIRPIDIFEQDIKLGAEFSFGILKPIIRASFLKAHGLAYREDARYGEDLLLMAEMLLCGAQAILIPDALYIYTTRVGDRSGKESPHSRSLPRFDQFADNIDQLQDKYGAGAAPEVRRSMSVLARRFRLVHGANLAKAARIDRGLFAYGMYLLRRPAVLGQVLRQKRLFLRTEAATSAGGEPIA